MQPNRSERRAIIKAEAKQLKKEGKKLAKNRTNSSRFNSKKSSRRKDDLNITDLFAASKSTDTFTIEYIHLSPDYDDSQEDDSDLEEKVANEQDATITATENIKYVDLYLNAAKDVPFLSSLTLYHFHIVLLSWIVLLLFVKNNHTLKISLTFPTRVQVLWSV